MAVEATFSSYKKNNYLMICVVCMAAAIWLAYDGYFSEKFEAEHTLEDGRPDSTMVFNQKAPFLLVPIAIGAMALFFVNKGKKVVAADDAVQAGSVTIPYDSIEQINKTHFDDKGYFILTYKAADGSEQELKVSDRTYDHLPLVLDHIIAKIS